MHATRAGREMSSGVPDLGWGAGGMVASDLAVEYGSSVLTPMWRCPVVVVACTHQHMDARRFLVGRDADGVVFCSALSRATASPVGAAVRCDLIWHRHRLGFS